MATKEKEREVTDSEPSQYVVPSSRPHKLNTPFALQSSCEAECVSHHTKMCVSHITTFSPSLSQWWCRMNVGCCKKKSVATDDDRCESLGHSHTTSHNRARAFHKKPRKSTRINFLFRQWAKRLVGVRGRQRPTSYPACVQALHTRAFLL